MKQAKFTWDGAREGWQRLGAANEQATILWLRSLSPEQSVAIFEELCEGIPELVDRPALDDPAPPVLSLIWK